MQCKLELDIGYFLSPCVLCPSQGITVSFYRLVFVRLVMTFFSLESAVFEKKLPELVSESKSEDDDNELSGTSGSFNDDEGCLPCFLFASLTLPSLRAATHVVSWLGLCCRSVERS